ncbi:hypothetical protein ACS0TY_015092 [Phlomoides rotata]
MILWRIWKECNQRVWSGTSLEAGFVPKLVKGFLEEWLAARKPNSSTVVQSRCKVWHKPHMSFCKLNVDVTLFYDIYEMGIGMAIHDENDTFVGGRSLVVPGIYMVDEGEAMGLLEALSLLKQLGLQRIKIEIDVKIVVDVVKSTRGAISVFNDFIIACKREMTDFPHVTVHFVL